MKRDSNGDWGLGIGDWGLGQSPIPNPHPQFLKMNFFNMNKKIILN
jgi:hypothetical protein